LIIVTVSKQRKTLQQKLKSAKRKKISKPESHSISKNKAKDTDILVVPAKLIQKDLVKTIIISILIFVLIFVLYFFQEQVSSIISSYTNL